MRADLTDLSLLDAAAPVPRDAWDYISMAVVVALPESTADLFFVPMSTRVLSMESRVEVVRLSTSAVVNSLVAIGGKTRTISH